MIKALVQKLGLDKLGEVLADEARRVQVEVLREERAALAMLLTKLDARLAALGVRRGGRPRKSAPVAPPTKPRRKARVTPKPGETLRDMVQKALATAGGPVKVATLVDLVKEVGYKSNALRSTLLTSIYTVLADRKLFRKFGTGIYGLVAAPAAPRKAAKPKRRRRVGLLIAAPKEQAAEDPKAVKAKAE